MDDGTTLNKYSSALAAVGVQIKDTAGEMRSMDAILNDLGAKWQTLGKDTQIALAQVVGGVRQYNQIISLMDNWDAFEMNVDIALNSEGSLEEQAEIYAESWEAANKRVQASLESIYSSLLDDKFFIGFNNILAEVLEQVNNFIKGMGGVKGVVVSLGTILVSVFNQQITASLKNLTYNIQMLTKTGQQRLAELQRESQELLKELGSDKGTVGGGVIADAYAQEAKMQQQLLSVSEKLSAQERERANTHMRILQMRTDEQVKAGEEASTAQRSLDIATANLERIQNTLGNNSISQLLGKSLKDIIQDINGIGAAAPIMSSAFDTAAVILKDSSMSAEEKITNLKNMLEGFKDIPLPKGLEEPFKKVYNEVNAAEPSLKKIKQAFSDLLNPVDKVKESTELYILKLRELSQAELDKGNTEKALEYKRVADALDTARNSAETYGQALQKANISQKNSAQAAAALGKFLEEAGIQTMSAQEKLVTYARVLGSVAMAVNQIKGLIEVWNDDTKSLGDKLLTTFTTLGFLIPTLISTGTAVKNLGISIKATSMAWQGYEKGAIKGSIATMGFGSAAATAMPYLVAISAILVAVGAAVYGIAKAVNDNPLERLNKEIAKTKAEGKALRSELQEIGKEIDTIYDEFDEYEKALEALDSLTVGTQAWYDQLALISGLTDDLMTSFPVLADMVAHPNKYAGITIKDEQGNFTPEALELAQGYTVRQQVAKAAGTTANTVVNREELSGLYDEATTEEVQVNFGNGFSWVGEGAQAPYRDRVLELLTPVFTAMVGSGRVNADSSDDDLFNPHNIIAQMKEMPEYYNPETGYWTDDAYQLMWGIQGDAGHVTRTDRNSAVDYNIWTQDYELRKDEDMPEEYFEEGMLSWLARDNNKVANTVGGSNQHLAFSNAAQWGNDFITYLFGSTSAATNSRQTQEEIYNDDVDTAFDSLGYYGLEMAGIEDKDITTALAHAYGIKVKNEAQPLANIEEMIANNPGGIAELLGYPAMSGINFTYNAEEDTLSYQDPYAEEETEPLVLKNASIALGEMQWLSDNAENIETVADAIGVIHSDVTDPADFALLERYYGGTAQADFTQEELTRLDTMGARVNSEYLDENLWGNEALSGHDFTYAQANRYLNLSESQRGLIDPYLSEHPELLSTVNGDGYAWINSLNQELEKLGYNVTEKTDEVLAFEAEITKGHLPIEQYGNFNTKVTETIDLIKELREGTSEDISLLMEMGLDTSGLEYTGDGRLKGDVDLSGVLNDYTKLQNVYKLLNYNPTDKSYNYDNDIETVAGYFGYSKDEWEALSEEVRESLVYSLVDAYNAMDYDSLVADVVSFSGFQYIDNLPELTSDQLDLAARSQAHLDGYDYDTLEANTGIDIVDQDSYNQALRAQKGAEGFDSLLGWGSSFEKLDEKIRNGATIQDIGEDLNELSKILEDFTGISGVFTPEWIRDNWGSIEQIFQQGSFSGLQTALATGENSVAFNPSEYYTSMVASTFGEAEQFNLYDGVTNGVLNLLDSLSLKEGYFETGRNEWNASGTQLQTLLGGRNVEGGQRMTENQALYFKEAGLLDKSLFRADGTLVDGWEAALDDSKLTEAARALGYESVDQLVSGLETALNNGVKEFDIDTSGFNQSVMNAYKDFADAKNSEDQYYLNTAEDQQNYAKVLNTGYETAGAIGLKYYNQMAQDMVQAGVSIEEFNNRISNVDWTDAESVRNFGLWCENATNSTVEFDTALQAVETAANAAARALITITEAANEYNQKTSMADKLRSGEALTPEEYQSMVDIYGDEEARRMMTLDAMGQYHLAEGYSPETVASEIESSASAGYQAVNQEASAVLSDYNSGYMNGVWTSQDKNTLNYAVNHADELSSMGVELTPEQIQAFTVASQEGTTYSDMKATMNDPEVFGENFNWDALFAALTSIAEKEQEESGEAMADAEERIPRENWEKEVSDLGLDVEETDKLGDSIQQMAEGMSEAELEAMGLSKALADNEELADELAKKVQRYNRAVDKITDSYEDWKKAIKSEDWEESSEAISEVKDTVEDMLDLPMDALDDLALSAEDATEMLELMDKAAEGDIDAYNELQSVVAEDIMIGQGAQVDPALQSALDTISSEVDNLPVGLEQPFMIGEGSAVSQDLYDSMNAVLAATAALGGDVAGNMQAVAKAMGMDVEVETKTFDVTVLGPTYKPGDPIYDEATGITYTPVTVGTDEESGTVTGVAIKAITNKGSSFGGNVGTRGGSSSRSRRGGGGGRRGGRGSSRAVRGTQKKESDKERYHTITNQLEDLKDAYDKVSKAADRAFGISRIKLLQDQTKELKKLAAAQQDYIDEINSYYKQDLSNLDKVASFSGVQIQLDKNGTITNYDAIQDAMWSQYNSHINNNKEVIGMDEDAWKNYGEEWEDVMDLIEQYEKTQDLRKEALQQLQSYIDDIYDLQLKEITYAVEIDISASDEALDILDYLLGRIKDDAWSAAEAIAYMGDKAAAILDNNKTYNGGIQEILMNHTKDIRDSEGGLLQAAQLTEADVAGFLNGDQEAIDKILQLNDAFTSDEVDSLREYYMALIKINKSLVEFRDTVYGEVLTSFEAFNGELDKNIDKIDHLSKITENYKNIVDIVGKKNLNVSNALLESIGQANVEQKINRVDAAKVKRDSITSEIARAEEALMNARANGLEEDAKLWEETLDEMRESLDKAEEDFMDSWREALNSIKEQFELAVNDAVETLSDALAGPLLSSMDQLQDAFDRQNTIAERYLPDYEKIYELNKLNRDITNSIDETDNIKAKQELASLQAEINALEESEAQISEYQMENLRRRYELKLAELALTEAQDAKSQVQMTRDASGNWNYVYTANEDQVAEAEQNYEDKLFALQQANAEYINSLNDSIIQLETEMAQKIEEIMLDETLSAEERMAKLQEVTAFYQGQMKYYADELTYVLGENQIVYEQDWAKYNELTGYKMSANEDYVDHFNETALGVLTGFETMEEFQRNFNDAIGSPDTGGLLYDLNNAYEMWAENTESAMKAAGTSTSDFADSMAEDVKDILDSSKKAADGIEEMGETIVETFDQIVDAVENWANVYSEKIDDILSKNTALAESFNKLIQSWSDFDAATGIDDEEANEDTEEDTGSSDVASDSEGGDAEAIGQITIHKGYQYWGYSSPKGREKDRVRVVNSDRQERSYKFTQMDTSTKRKRVYIPSEGLWVSSYDPDGPKRISVEKFDTGGYTGSWGSEGRLAMLHQKEIVLNKDDTSNLLNAVDMIRQIAKVIDINAYNSAGFGASLFGTAEGKSGTLEQNVHITAEFPYATNREEIYSAFTDILNLASQYANRK